MIVLLRIPRWLALLFVAGLVVPAFAQDAVDLNWKFEKDKTFYQEMTTDVTQKMTVMGQEITQKQQQTFYFSWTPKEQKDKDWVIQQKITGVKMNIGRSFCSSDAV